MTNYGDQNFGDLVSGEDTLDIFLLLVRRNGYY